jgi:GxxExxY protein
MADEITKNIISAAIGVHRHLGPGLLESIYEAALCHELDMRNMSYDKQKQIDVIYKGIPIKGQRIDIIVENKVIVELKATNHFNELFISQTLSYLKATGLSKALIINFAKRKLIDGIKRVCL